jgi:hypothetical protein
VAAAVGAVYAAEKRLQMTLSRTVVEEHVDCLSLDVHQTTAPCVEVAECQEVV